MRTLVLLVAALAVAIGVDVLIGAEHSGRVPILVLTSTFVLTFLAKGLGTVLQRPVGSRPGEARGDGLGDA